MNRRTLNISKFQKILVSFFVFLLVLLAVSYVYGRPGGGQSYSGGGYSSAGGYGGGGGGGALFYLIFSMLPPEVSVPLLLLFFVIYLVGKYKSRSDNFNVSSNDTNYYSNLHRFISVSQQIATLRGIDPNFSRVLFLDFAFSLYTKFYSYYTDKKQLTALTPFFDKKLMQQFLKDKAAFKIDEIVIGGIFIEKISFWENTVGIYVRFKSNMTIIAQGKAARYRLDERWLFLRDKDVISPEPEKMHVVSCPACGAPADFTDSGYCKHCGTLIVQGKMQWYVSDRKVFEFTAMKTENLLTYAPERGTELPTILDPYLEQKIRVFESANNVSWPEYEQKFKTKIIQPYFDEIYKAWSSLKWNRVRHLLTDRLWESYNFWIKAYKQAGLRNVLDIQIEKIEVAKLEIDRFYEAITVRIFANGLDYVVDRRGRVMAGSNKRKRRFSEYWTFIRRSGVEKDEYDIHTCPACGAPIENIGQNGVCQYCGNKITWGDFSWVVALIVQDEEYRG